MPRQARLDAPGTLHHVMLHGIERRVWDKSDGRRLSEAGRSDQEGAGRLSAAEVGKK